MVLVTQAQLGQFQPANCSGFGGSLSDFGKKSTKKFSTVGSPTKLTDAREFYRLTTAMPQSQRTHWPYVVRPGGSSIQCAPHSWGDTVRCRHFLPLPQHVHEWRISASKPVPLTPLTFDFVSLSYAIR